ncbi:protein kinase [Streptosporangium sp. NPDC000396]|uniref:serine/threonine-protein kinase n=1 Tax=Streptosporangium sp. NPDC000396 TaxID=3366185 RepID=UPI0036850279
MPYAQPLKPGDPGWLGEYEIVGRLGDGGQGVVYLGVHCATGSEPYAVKLLHDPLGDDQEGFLREVELAKQVARFCIAQVIDAGLEGDRPYIVSEYVDGPSLHREVAVGGPREGGGLERLAIGTATALAAIHRAGIVHRDFKPQNVLIGPDGPRVIDFGLARALEPGATQSGRGAGTPAYMAPEQVEGAEIGPAADVFSWGATMCFAANAQAPFGQDSIAAVLHRILTALPELGHLDGWLGALVADCLDKDQRNRPTSQELLLALLGDDGRRAVLESTSGPALPVRISSSRPPAPPVSLRSPPPISGRGTAGESTEPWTHQGRAATRASVAVSGALLVSTAVLVGVLVPALSGAGGRSGGERAAVPTAEPGTRPASGARADSTPRPGKVIHAADRPTPGTGVTTTSPPSPPSPPSSPPAAGQVQVPALVGLDRPEALRLIKHAGLVVGALTPVDSVRPIGQVLKSRPQARTAVAKGSTVDLEISAGVRVPVLAGLHRRLAEAALAQAGLTLGEVTTRCSGRSAGRVLASTPGVAEHVSAGSAVALVVSRRGAPVPSVVGRREAEARRVLEEAGFAVRTRPRLVGDPSQVGVVLAQRGAFGGCARPNAVVVIAVGVERQSDPGPGEPTVQPDPAGPDQPGPAEDPPSG